jgi:Arc/MetJ-type ribon-helix-helix transcriptional regulator
MRTKKAGRPFVYQTDAERPMSVTVRVPHALYDEVQSQVERRRTTISAAILEGLQWWLDTPVDPRELLASDKSNTVIQELQAMVAAMVQAELAKREGDAPVMQHAIQHDSSNTVLQKLRDDETPTAPVSRTQKRETVAVMPRDGSYGAVPTAVLAALEHQQPATAAELATALGDNTRQGVKTVWQALQRLSKSGRVLKQGKRYQLVPHEETVVP